MMKIKLGILALIAAGVASSLAATNVLALTTGHFTSEAPQHHVIIKGTEAVGTPHHVILYEIKNEVGHPKEGTLFEECTHVAYQGTLTSPTTTTAIQIRPTYNQCYTPGDPAGQHNVAFDVPATCGANVLEFTSGGTGTLHINCTITITRQDCVITIPPQTTSGVKYTTITESGKHALTVDLNLTTLSATYHAGICTFLGTTHYLEMAGSITVWAEDTAGSRIGITHT